MATSEILSNSVNQGREAASVLILDSEPLSAAKIEKILLLRNFKVSTAKTIGQAISLVNHLTDIKLVISEISISDGDSIKFLKYMTSNSNLSRIPVIMCSASGNHDLILKYISGGAKDFVAKPVDPDILISKITKIFERIYAPPKNILIVDDDEFIRNFLMKSVEREGYKPIVASDGKQALELLEKYEVAAVISDIVMPEVGGFELLKKIKTDRPHIPVLLITGQGGKTVAEKVKAAGADGYITKPFKNIEIANTLKGFNLKST